MTRGTLGPYVVGPNEFEECGIYIGNAYALGVEIPDESVSLVYCDPVYDDMGQYEWLAVFAHRVLKYGGSLIAQCGNHYRYNAEANIRHWSGLRPRILLSERLTGGHTQLWVDRALVCTKPHLWFTKGNKITRKGWMPEMVDGGGAAKKYHKWGDSTQAAETWIGRLTEPGDVVVDPFTGGGMVPVACIRTGRRYVAFEIEEARAKTARRNCVLAQPSMIHPVAQLEMGFTPGERCGQSSVLL